MDDLLVKSITLEIAKYQDTFNEKSEQFDNYIKTAVNVLKANKDDESKELCYGS